MQFNWKYLSTFEPAALRGVWVSVVGLLTALGLQLSDTLTGKADAILAAAVVIIPILQGLWTRQAVVPVARAELEPATIPTEPPSDLESPATIQVEQEDPKPDQKGLA
jgi:hypothetical protein